jgi:hypothetical protein
MAVMQSSFEKFMSEFIPVLLQMKLEKDRMKGWLEKSLTEYQAYGQQQKELMSEGSKKQVLETILNVLQEGSKGRPYPGTYLRKEMTGLLPAEMTSQLPTLPEAEPVIQDKMTAAQEAAGRILIAQQSNQPVDENDLGIMIDAFGINEPTEIVKAIQQGIGEEAGRGIRLKEIEDAIKGRKVQERELGIREQELGVAKEKVGLTKYAGKTSKELEKELKKLQADRTTAAEKLVGIGMPTGISTRKQRDFINTRIQAINNEIMQVGMKLGKKNVLPTDQDYTEFQNRALASKKAGMKINWDAAILQGFDPAWLEELRTKIEGGK